MSTPLSGPDRYDPSGIPPSAATPPSAPTGSRLIKWGVVAVTLALVLIPTLWGALPGEIARWHDAAARELYLDGDLQGAIAQLDMALTWHDSSAQRFFQRAAYRRDAGDLSGALEDCNAAFELVPDSRALLIMRSTIHQQLGQHQAALDDHLEMEKQLLLANVRDGSARATTLNNTAYVRAVGRIGVREGLIAVQEAIKLLGGDTFLLEQTGYLHVLRMDWPRAKTRLKEAATALEGELDALKTITEQLAETAASETSPALRREIEDRLAGVQFHLARACRELNETEEADKYEKLSSSWGRSEKSLRDRLPSLERAWQICLQQSTIVDTRGFLQYRLGDYAVARRDLELAVEIVELDFQRGQERFEKERMLINDIREYRIQQTVRKKGAAVVVYHRALVYEKLGLADQAAKEMRRVREVYGCTPDESLF